MPTITIPQAFDLALQHHQAGRLAEAEQLYRQILAVEPAHAEASHRLGLIAMGAGHLEPAEELIRKAIALLPGDARFHSNLGCVLERRDRLDEAIAAHHEAIRLQPDYAAAHYNLGNALGHQGRLDAAVAAYQRAVEIRPDFSIARGNLASALLGQGKVAEAIAAYRRTIECQPADVLAHTNLLLALHYESGFDAGAIFAEHRRWDEIHARPLAASGAAHANDRNPDRPLRVGYVSPDFRQHSIAFFTEGLLAGHDRAQVEVFAYDDAPAPDAVTQRLRNCVAQWRRIRGMGDAQVAELIRRDGIDLLVDLSGHTAGNRLLVFARRPAPVQVTYLGYCDTTGMRAMDFRLTDAHADPPGTTEQWHTETLVRLPDCAWCFRPCADAPPVGAASGTLTFGCFNTLPKITGAILALWSEIRRRVPGARLLIKNPGLCDPAEATSTVSSRFRFGWRPLTMALGPSRSRCP